MNKYLFSIILLATLAVVGFAQTPGKITGTVSFGDDKAVIHQVAVKVVELNKTALTDDLGGYTFANVPPGTYRVTTHLEGFADATRSVTVTGGATASADFELKLSGINAEVTVTASGTAQSTF
ncbi:MAG: carboxypeptidase regulatory-like domain-containing protein [Chloracidobacterium sp.]|nr:carboxypeptidase regulatory-like domain-containing protein [Chloracidobacterium sp.]